MNGDEKKYLVSAIVWTVICALALGILVFAVRAEPFPKVCALVLVILCLAGQWLRYAKAKRG